MNTSKLILKRKKHINNAFIKAEVHIDDVLTDILANGEQKEFDLAAGPHTIKIKQRINSAELKIDVAEGQVVSYSFQPTYLNFITAVSAIFALISLHYHWPKYCTGILIAPGIAVSIYLLIAGRRKYFVFKEMPN